MTNQTQICCAIILLGVVVSPLQAERPKPNVVLIQKNARSVDSVSDEVIDPIAAGHPVIRLWPIDQNGGEQNTLSLELTNPGKIRYQNVKDPNLVAYQVQRNSPTPAVIYCPGGSYIHLTPRPEIIQWFNDNGITVFMLRYTVPNDREEALKDVQRAMRLLRHSAAKWNIDPDQLGVVGSSAGGHLVARLSQHFETPAYQAVDEADRESCEPKFVVLFSAAYFFRGQGKKQESVLAEEFPMTAKVAPTFLIYAKNDKAFFGGGIAYEKALKAAGGSTRILISETGGHGLKDVDWYPECREWLKGIGVNLEEESR